MKISHICLIACFLIASACGGGSKTKTADTEVTEQSMEESSETTEPTETAESKGMMAGEHKGMMSRCPMHVEGTTMALEDTEKGVAMRFTNEDATEEVQARAMQMADHHPKAMEHHGSSLPAYTLEAEKTETGAMLVMMPEDASQMDAFRAAVHERHEAQGDQKCPMMMMYEKSKGPHKKQEG